jgi:hypothetical protein
MHMLSAQALLHTWEQAQSVHPLRRSLALLATAWPELDAQAWGAMPVGTRDAWLYTLQESLFGRELDTRAACPACAEPLELQLATSDLRQEPAAEAEGPRAAPQLRCEGYQIGYRLPCSDDLLAAADAPATSAQAAVQALLKCCIFEARYQGAETAVAELPAPVIDSLQREMAMRDPGADTRIAVACPGCGHAFERRFDIGAYLWDALDDWAQRTLAEVHLLASAYGWSEPQILALAATRRRHYIALVQA